MARTRKSHPHVKAWYKGRHKSEHWYRDNQVYFITARCRGRFRAFASERAKSIFWDRFAHYTGTHGFTPWVTSLIDNHYHTVGYLREGDQLGPMMQRIHGSVAKLVNDVLEQEAAARAEAMRLKPHGPTGSDSTSARLTPFWKDTAAKNYFDGCLRSEKQGQLTYRYVLTQCRRHGLCSDPRDYLHTHVNVELERAIARALELEAFLSGVRYRRYEPSCSGGDARSFPADT